MSESLRLEWIDPAELQGNPQNWRRHLPAQVSALRDAIAEVGWAGALLYNERTGRLIDGHLRKDQYAGQKVPVLIGSWDEAAEKKILATLDPLGALAEVDVPKLDALLREVSTGSEDLAAMLTKLAEGAGIVASEVHAAPADFKAVDESIPIEHICPNCGWQFSGGKTTQ